MIRGIILLFVAVAAVYGLETASPRGATLEIASNFEFGLGMREFRVHYLGISGDNSGSESATIKIYKESTNTPVITHVLADSNKQEAYYFALENADAGFYEVEVCLGNDKCSQRTRSLTEMPDAELERKIKCNQGRVNGDLTWTDDSANPFFQITVLRANNFMTADDIRAVGPTTDFHKIGLEQTPVYTEKPIDGKNRKILYLAVKYPVGITKPLYMNTNEDAETQNGLRAHSYCERKFIMSVNFHLVKKGTKHIAYRYKTTINVSDSLKTFIKRSNGSANSLIHVELKHIFEDEETPIAAGTYDVWVTFCTNEKDMVDSTICSEPLIKQDYLEVAAPVNN